MFILYTVAPILYRMASSAYYNLSLLSSDFYGLLFVLLITCYSLWIHRLAYLLLAYCYTYYLRTRALSTQAEEREGQAKGGTPRGPHALPRERTPRRNRA